jgi:hypothetical protein
VFFNGTRHRHRAVEYYRVSQAAVCWALAPM